MNMSDNNASSIESWRLAEHIIEAALIDTVNGDLYMQRARYFLEPALKEGEFVELQFLETEALNLPNKIYNAINQGNWKEVKELTCRMLRLKHILAEKERLYRLGEKIYKQGELPLDPFSPGLQELSRSNDLQALLHKLSTHLEWLKAADPDLHDFYVTRKIAMTGIKAHFSPVLKEEELSRSQLEHKAIEALNDSNFSKLEKMAALIEREESDDTERSSSHPSLVARNFTDFRFKFPQNVLKRAQNLGFLPMSTSVSHP